MSEGLDLHDVSGVWVNDAGQTCFVAAPDDGPWYQVSGELFEALLRAAGYRPDGEVKE